MGVRQLGAIAERLISHGRIFYEAAAVIERGTLPGQRVVSGTLGTIASDAASAEVRAPASGGRPGRGIAGASSPGSRLRARSGRWPALTVAVTRARAQASGLAARLRSPWERPWSRRRRSGSSPLDGPPLSVAGYDLICLTSPNGVRLLFDHLVAPGLDARALAGVRVAAIGPGTAAALRSYGVVADVVPPERFVAEGLVEALADVPVTRALVARAASAPVTSWSTRYGSGVRRSMWCRCTRRWLFFRRCPRVAALVGPADYVTFTSSSTVRFLVSTLGGDGSALRGLGWSVSDR